jgi:hypothetical protein
MAERVIPQGTPNPNAMRFSMPGATLGDKGRTFTTREAAAGVPFAEALLALQGVVSVFALKDFVTVTKAAGTAWEPLVKDVVAALERHA